MEELKVIQGDTLNVTLTIENPEELEINRVVFTCPSLNMQRDLTELNDDDLWGFVIQPAETNDLWVGRWDFDITAFTVDSERYTVIHKGQFVVEHKRDRNIQPIPPGVITGIGWTED